MENPFGSISRTARRGRRNFSGCNLKDLETAFIKHGTSIYFSQVKVSLRECPTLEDLGEDSMDAYNPRSTHKDARAVKGAMHNLALTCGATICGNCVYAGMKTPIEVNKYRIERDKLALEALVAHRSLVEAHEEIASIEAESGLGVQVVELRITGDERV